MIRRFRGGGIGFKRWRVFSTSALKTHARTVSSVSVFLKNHVFYNRKSTKKQKKQNCLPRAANWSQKCHKPFSKVVFEFQKPFLKHFLNGFYHIKASKDKKYFRIAALALRRHVSRTRTASPCPHVARTNRNRNRNRFPSSEGRTSQTSSP